MKSNNEEIEKQIEEEKASRERYREKGLLDIVVLYDGFIEKLEGLLDETT